MNRARFDKRDVPRTIAVTCVDNDRSVEAMLIDRFDDRLTVELPGGVRLVMRKHHSIPGIYIASHSGMEFQANTKGD